MLVGATIEATSKLKISAKNARWSSVLQFSLISNKGTSKNNVGNHVDKTFKYVIKRPSFNYTSRDTHFSKSRILYLVYSTKKTLYKILMCFKMPSIFGVPVSLLYCILCISVKLHDIVEDLVFEITGQPAQFLADCSRRDNQIMVLRRIWN